MVDQIFYLLSAVLLGTVIGALIMYFVSSNKNKGKDSEAAIAEVENKLNAYQEDVSNHFEQTADLIDDLTLSYKKVFDHMSKSAKQLMSEEQIQFQIEKRKGHKVTLAFLHEEESDDFETVAEEDKEDAKQNNADLNDKDIENQQNTQNEDESREKDKISQHSDGHNVESNLDQDIDSDEVQMSAETSSVETTVSAKRL